MNLLRFAFVAAVCAPFVWRERHKLNRQNLGLICIAGLYLAVAVSAFVHAVKVSQANYVAIIALLTPIVLLIYSVRLYGEKLSQRTLSGITLAALGGCVLVLLPLADASGGVHFYPLATVLMLMNCLTYPVAILTLKKANETGVSMVSLIGLTSLVVAAISAVLLVVIGGDVTAPTGGEWFTIAYSGLAVALIGRMCKVWSFEHIGAAATSAVMYVETFLAIVLPIVVLHERLTVSTVVGGMLVLAGVYVVESHRLLAHRQHHFWRSH